VTLLIDTTNTEGAGATQDTYTLLRKGTRKLLKAMGYHLPGKRQGCSAEIEKLLATYVDQDRRAEIDWSDPVKRNEQLKPWWRIAKPRWNWRSSRSTTLKYAAWVG